jgi:hypothetical protein
MGVPCGPMKTKVNDDDDDDNNNNNNSENIQFLLTETSYITFYMKEKYTHTL